MSIEIWLAFVSTVFVFAIIPGPTVIFVIGQAITYGKKSVAPLALGVLFGDFIAMVISLLGLGAILSTSAVLYGILKWFGVFYLIYLGIKAFKETPEVNSNMFTQKNISQYKMFKSSAIVTALNPKNIIFFVAFLPQFVNTSANVLPQFIILMLSFSCVTFMTISSFAIFSGKIQHKIKNYTARKRLNQIGGTALIGAGIFTATMHKNS
ncbi:LysE family translocator [Sulfurospirillum arcachonense]|uniref:LysE family translocator n=1 Tax=Sulfurospirillum arcachonense TaxID=57666 RepID=UPI000469A80A|nr:LysE family translocator [Sulfurospirillum arcachonense]